MFKETNSIDKFDAFSSKFLHILANKQYVEPQAAKIEVEKDPKKSVKTAKGGKSAGNKKKN